MKTFKKWLELIQFTPIHKIETVEEVYMFDRIYLDFWTSLCN